MATLCVTVVHCRGVKGFELIGETDPFVVLTYGRLQYKTRVEDEAGEDADFYETFEIPMSRSEPLLPLELRVLDKDLFRNELMGTGSVELEQVMEQGHCVVDCMLRDTKGRENGRVRLAVKAHQDESHCCMISRNMTSVEETTHLDRRVQSAGVGLGARAKAWGSLFASSFRGAEHSVASQAV